MLTPRDPARTCEAHLLEGDAGVQGLLALEPDKATNALVAFRASCRTGATLQPIGERDLERRGAQAVRPAARRAQGSMFEGCASSGMAILAHPCWKGPLPAADPK